MTEQELLERDAKRDLGAELLEAVRDMKAGRVARVTHVAIAPLVAARNKAGCSQREFAALLGVSQRTLEQWEQGRRQPTGAARTLIRIAIEHPEVLRT